MGNISLVIRNVLNQADTRTVTTDSFGQFTVPYSIPGDVYEVKPQMAADSGLVAGAVEVKSLEAGSDVGNVSVAAVAYNFKASPVVAGSGDPTGRGKRLYADGQSYNVNIEIKNV
jgi:hypothetical protein